MQFVSIAISASIEGNGGGDVRPTSELSSARTGDDERRADTREEGEGASSELGSITLGSEARAER